LLHDIVRFCSYVSINMRLPCTFSGKNGYENLPGYLTKLESMKKLRVSQDIN
jgi:hypothetical protein